MHVCVCVCVCVCVYVCVFPGNTVVNSLPADSGDTGDMGSIPGSGSSLQEGDGNPLLYSCLGNPMDTRNLIGYSSWGLKRIRYNLVIK